MPEDEIPTAEPTGNQRLVGWLFSWVFVGAVAAILFSFGGGCMTGHPYIADAFCIAGILILLVKFWTWEEAKHDTHRKTAFLLAGVTVFLLCVGTGLCVLSWYLSKPVNATAQADPTKQNQLVLSPQQSHDTKQASAPVSAQPIKPLASTVYGNSPTQTASPSPAYQQSCQGSACAQGPGSQATFNQFGIQPRKMLHADAISSCLSASHGKLVIHAALGDSESNSYAAQWLDIFHNAKWDTSDVLQSVTYSNETHQIFRDIAITIHGEFHNGQFKTDDPAAQTFVNCLNGTSVADKVARIEPMSSAPSGEVSISVGSDSRQ